MQLTFKSCGSTTKYTFPVAEVYFLGDLHYAHKNIINYCNRPFLSLAEQEFHDRKEPYEISQETVDRHNTTLIQNINHLVKQSDVLFLLGDQAFSYNNVMKSLDLINCNNIFFIYGNHDPENISHRKIIRVADLALVSIDGQSIVLCHYALDVWEHMYRKFWHLYGHSHNAIEEERKKIDKYALSLDVGVDCHKMRPWSMTELREEMGSKERQERYIRYATMLTNKDKEFGGLSKNI